MIRTLIEVTGEDRYKFDDNLKAALDKLGFERKPEADEIRWKRDLSCAMREKGIDPFKLVEEYRAKLAKDNLA